ncbi:MAG TPA: S1 RNA-binding domain-containing protein [Candidatus Eisenbergiella pullicola]|nr:S1 RNA-binding domain-containing protein [Candidatus Eisenbergiella pullicola]
MEEIKTGIADVEEDGAAETMEDYSKELEASFRTIREGDIISGSVIDVSETGVTLDLGYYAPGVIKAEDYSRDPSFSILNDVHVGDAVEGTVVKTDDGAGNIQLSRVEAAEVKGWDKLQKDLEEGTTLTVKVSEAVNKGVVAYVDGIRGFIPASRLSLSYVEDLETFVGKTLEVRVITVEKARKKLVLSAKEILKEKEEEALNHKIAMLVPGTIMEGRVESLMPYGAFVDLGDGLSGLVHISQISQRRIKKPSEVLNVGDAVKVKVLNTNNNKISLSMKAVEESARPDEEEEKRAAQYSSRESIGTSLGDLLKGLKL